MTDTQPSTPSKPRKIKLTDPKIADLRPPATGQFEIYDTQVPAFGVRVSFGGRKSFFVFTRINGRLIRVGLGEFPDRKRTGEFYPGVRIEEARDKAREIRAQAKHGIDPRAETAKRKAEEEAARAATFSFWTGKFFASPAARKLRPASLRSYRTILLGETAAPLRDKPVAMVARKDVIAILRALEADDKHGMAALARTTFSAFFSWLLADEQIGMNPASNIKLAGRAEEEATKPLSLAEIKRIYTAASAILGPGGALTRLLVLTAKRRLEASLMRWSDLGHVNGGGELVLDGNITADYSAIWVIRATVSKNGRSYTIPIVPKVAEILRARPNLPGNSYVFATSGAKQFATFDVLKKQLDAALTQDGGAPMPAWSFHSFRHAFSTYANGAALARPEVVEQALGHEAHRSGVASIYNRADYLAEHRRLLMVWAQAVTGTEAGANVVPLRAGQ